MNKSAKIKIIIGIILIAGIGSSIENKNKTKSNNSIKNELNINKVIQYTNTTSYIQNNCDNKISDIINNTSSYESKISENNIKETSEVESISKEYVLNKNTHKFHNSNCSSVSQMKESNTEYYIGTREEIISKGYEPCKRCNP